MRISPISRGHLYPSSASGETQRSALYQSKATEIKELARHMHEPSARGTLVTLALGYELLADRLRSRFQTG